MKKFSLRVDVYENGLHIVTSSHGQMIGNLTTKIKETHYNKDAEKLLKNKGYVKVLINGCRREWVLDNDLKNGYYSKVLVHVI